MHTYSAKRIRMQKKKTESWQIEEKEKVAAQTQE
jgi:post-segregation antitoxin (ccd killing protein)